MNELDKLIEGHFGAKEKKPESLDLIALIEATLDEVYEKVVIGEKQTQPAPSIKTTTAKEFLLSLPKFSPNESWGDPNSVDRQTVNKVFSVIGGGATVEEKLKFIQQISNPANQITSPRRIISTLIVLESLAAVVNNFSSSPAGFVFEGFLSALFRGKQEVEISPRGNLPIQDFFAFSELGSGGLPVSLKMLRKKGIVEGSYSNLIDALDEYGKMVYLVARKMGDEIALEEFAFTRDNFIDAISTAANGERTIEAGLFKLPNKTPSASVNFINSLDSWPEKFKALQRTSGYQYSESEPTQLDDYEKEKAEKEKETQQQSSQQKTTPWVRRQIEDHWSYDLWVNAGYDLENIEKRDLDGLGLDPDSSDYPSEPKVASKKDIFWSHFFGFGNRHRIKALMRDSNSSTPVDLKKYLLKFSSDHRMLKENRQRHLLSESSKTQWKITPAQLPKMKDIDYKLLGTLPYGSEKIEKIAEIHMNKLSESLIELFESTKALSDNINNYFTYEKRNEAIKSGEVAIKDTIKIQNSLKKEITRKD